MLEGKSNNKKLMANFGVFVVCLLASFLAVYFYSPVIKTHARAELDGPIKNIDVNVSVAPELSLTISSSSVLIEADINSFAHNSVDVMVRTNSAYGYTLAIEDADNDTKMVHDNSTVSDVFTSDFTGAKTSETLDTNTWGWSPDGGNNYYFIPENGKPAVIDNRPGYISDTVTKSIDFGVKVGNVTSGDYHDAIVFTAYPNGVGRWPSNTSLYDKEDGSSIIPPIQGYNCDALATGQTTRLRDIRDNNVYTVMKLDDGYCWMMEYLRLTNKTLTPADSNVSSNFVLKGSNINDFVVDANHPGSFERDAVYFDGSTAYYSPYALHAGLNQDFLDSEADVTTGYYELENSVCPAGWHLISKDHSSYISDIYRDSGFSVFRNSALVNGSQIIGTSEAPPDEMLETGAIQRIIDGVYATSGDFLTITIPTSGYHIYYSSGIGFAIINLSISREGEVGDGSVYSDGIESWVPGVPVTCVNGNAEIPEQHEGDNT